MSEYTRRGFMGFLGGIPLFWGVRSEQALPVKAGPIVMVVCTDKGEEISCSNPFFPDRAMTVVKYRHVGHRTWLHGGHPVCLLPGDSLSCELTET